MVKSYNFLLPILNKMDMILNSYPNTKIIWFGNESYVPIINTYLLKNSRYISMVINNDSKKWGREVLNVYTKKTINENNLNKNIPKLYIQSPYDIKHNLKNVTVFLASKYKSEMIAQLVEMGVSEKCIYSFPIEGEECILENEDIKKSLLGWRKLSLDEIQKRELEILKHFKNFCDNNKLRYFLSGGTLLGAIRHKGFIPWDNDIDVYMPYDDYKKFLELYKDNKQYYLCNWIKDDNYILQFDKLIDCETLLFSMGFPVKMQIGVFIDIFPLVGFPDNPEKLKKKWKENVEFSEEWYKYYIARDILDNIQDPRKYIFEKKCMEYSYNESKMVGTMYSSTIKDVWAIETGCFSDYIPVLFENEYFNAPIGYNKYLTYRYGDYMKIPDEKNRVSHSFSAYIRE